MDNLAFREEADSIGNLLVPVEAYYGIQSLRAKQNFNINYPQGTYHCFSKTQEKLCSY